MDEQETKYDRILVARYNPKNKCYANEGAILILRPKKIISNKDHINHHFLDQRDKKTKPKYGWVKLITPITLKQFIDEYIGGAEDVSAIEHNKVMLDSIQSSKVDTPVAATYSERGIGKKQMELTVHRVFFYQK